MISPLSDFILDPDSDGSKCEVVFGFGVIFLFFFFFLCGILLNSAAIFIAEIFVSLCAISFIHALPQTSFTIFA